MKALEGTTRVTFLGFFASHIVFTLIVDSQALLPKTVVPAPLKALLAWYSATLGDPLMSDPHSILWFQSLVACEMIFQLPYFVLACHFLRNAKLSSYPEWFRYASIAYGAHTSTTMAPILVTLASNPSATLLEKAVIISVYLPYLIFPAAILMIAATVPTSTTKRKTN